MADETTTTAYAEVVPTEEIPTWIQNYDYPHPTGLAICWILRSDRGSIAHRFPRHDAFTITSGTKTQGASFTRLPLGLSEDSITPGIVGNELAITDELKKAAQTGSVEVSILKNAVDALVNRMDVDTLASSTAATNTTGADTDVFSVPLFLSAQQAYRALNLRGSHACVLESSSAYSDLVSDLHQSGSQLANLGSGLVTVENGAVGSYLGMTIFSSENVAATGGGFSNFMTPMGDMASGLGMVLVEGPGVETNRGSVGALDAETYHVLRAWYGAGIANMNRILEVVTS